MSSNEVRKLLVFTNHMTTASYLVPFVMRLAVSLTEEGKPGTLEKSEGIFPREETSGKHLPSTESIENNHNTEKSKREGWSQAIKTGINHHLTSERIFRHIDLTNDV